MSPSLLPYLRLARPDHWTKNVMIVPGIIFGLFLSESGPPAGVIWNVVLGLFSACLLASANYVINEWLDAETDRFHPEKCDRMACRGLVSFRGIVIEYILLVAAGLLAAGMVNLLFFLAAVCFFLSGLVYNVPPVRLKDIFLLDVIAESVNNPLRLVFGWAMVYPRGIPPVSLVLCFLFGGAFLMTVKRLSEYRHIAATKGAAAAGDYRRSFLRYNENNLTTASFTYAVLSSFLLGILLVKYKTEYILTLPLFTWLFAYYFSTGLQPDSVAQKPEKLMADRHLRLITFLLVMAFALLTAYNIDWLDKLLLSHFREMPIGRP